MENKKKKTVSFVTLGCKVNQYESNAMAQKFIEHGYQIVNFESIADIYIINTCTVTNMSDKKSRQIIRRAKKINKDALIVATGCYAQVAKDELEKINDIDLILGVNEKNNIVEYIEQFSNKDEHEEFVSDIMSVKKYEDFGSIGYTEKTRGVIKVQDGCDRFCSYCIIPYARGRVRSRKIDSVVAEVEKMVQEGIQEVVVTGIHVASYGKDFKENVGLIDLLAEINKIEGLQRIRLSSIEPTIITEEFISKLKKLEKICEHFHLSLQSGCNNTLKRMNRRYTIEQFKEIVNLIRREYENVALTTDIIVGFPGETEEEFNTTYENLKEINFYKLHVFKYSQREGTKAAIMENQISPEIKEKRSEILIKLTEEQKHNFHRKYIGKSERVLFEQYEGDYIKGHTSNYIMVYVKKEDANENEMKEVFLESEFRDGIKGSVIQM